MRARRSRWGTCRHSAHGSTDIAVYRPSTGFGFVRGGTTTQWGTAGDLPWRVATTTTSTSRVSAPRTASVDQRPSRRAVRTHGGAMGRPRRHPGPHDYDRNGRDNVAVFCPSRGLWFVQPTSNRLWHERRHSGSLRHQQRRLHRSRRAPAVDRHLFLGGHHTGSRSEHRATSVPLQPVARMLPLV